MTITERAAYIKGLEAGLGIDDYTKEGKVINALIHAFDDMALTVSDIEAEVNELSEQVDTIDEDLGSLEEDYYELEDDDECDCDCGYTDHDDENDDDEYLDEDIYEVCCPTCGDVVCIDSDMLEKGQTTCPNCGELLEFELEDEEDSCGCGDEDCGKCNE